MCIREIRRITPVWCNQLPLTKWIYEAVIAVVGGLLVSLHIETYCLRTTIELTNFTLAKYPNGVVGRSKGYY